MTGTPTDQERQPLDQRLATGARFARSEGRERLATLLEEVLAELQGLRQRTEGCERLVTPLGEVLTELQDLRQRTDSVSGFTDLDAGEVFADLQDFESRIGALERQVADIKK